MDSEGAGREGSAGRAAFFSRYFWCFLILRAFGFRTVYLEVMRVCALLAEGGGAMDRVIYCGRAGFEQQRRLLVPFGTCLQERHCEVRPGYLLGVGASW